MKKITVRLKIFLVRLSLTHPLKFRAKCFEEKMSRHLKKDFKKTETLKRDHKNVTEKTTKITTKLFLLLGIMMVIFGAVKQT